VSGVGSGPPITTICSIALRSSSSDVVVAGEPEQAALAVVLLPAGVGQRGDGTRGRARDAEHARGGRASTEQAGAAQEAAPRHVVGGQFAVGDGEVECGRQIAAGVTVLVIVIVRHARSLAEQGERRVT
jgi:hypothetical protein